jgi:hypothetical protein
MLWSDIDYKTQAKAINKIFELLLQEEDPKMRCAFEAAAHELETWSNHECDIFISEMELSDEEYVAIAQDSFIETKSDSLLSMFFGKK